ncbi:hypothetical protein [Aquimarina megaterium]|uniref:hypothetical protein n=1 Tax=Aquimarina megaterium TaxID=1443666 RepID=UPI000944C8F1|nr:hypothetical protein [Aquimarina megaterium]
MKINSIVKTLLELLIVINLVSCASFPKNYKDSISIDKKNVTELNGEYNIVGIKDTLKENSHNAFEKFYRSYGRFAKDTLKLDTLAKYTFSIRIIDNKKVNIKYLKNGKEFKDLVLKYKLKSNGFLYLKNQNFKIAGIPYIFGSLEEKKLRLRMDFNQNLIIEEAYHYSGALLIILGAGFDHTYRHHYEEVK